ncbi:MAG: hypothetical protein DSO07_07180 [Thermoproteota archaeon]|uniref:Uncharacterized protein n=1 Tax=Candidatus Methanodesulfokora washburnensis TaxID=2478471 RepID=A0A3R9RJZ8_9CREN|nr:hypothetical protein D6D85_15880 [Candidatus Methanodesulfokores washburnensis]RZN61976.1 MAG: hypothetical protein EF810_03935 [Candidatus Methanodesulfokores washburnensis]TDA40947.1 MAG: hypothetical protein DSO07_07180 [Candidatus Korarchaeota archaeon]
MRLWLIHPKHLDRTGLVTIRRKGLLAKRVLKGKTKVITIFPEGSFNNIYPYPKHTSEEFH